MDGDEIRKVAALEDRHWWYAGRRALVRRELAGVLPGRALDVGCGPGGNSSVLRRLGWQVSALDYSPASTAAAKARGLNVVRGDGTVLPFRDSTFDLVMSTDVWEHVKRDDLAASETFRVLRPGGRLFLVVPAGMDLWSGHDVANAHHRRYERDELVELVRGAGLRVDEVFSWNVLLRPVAKLRRRRNVQHDRGNVSEMEPVRPLLNSALRAVIATEAWLPVRTRRGVSLVIRATRPT